MAPGASLRLTGVGSTRPGHVPCDDRPPSAAGRRDREARPGCMAPSGSLCIRGLVRPTSRGFAGRRMVRHRGSRSAVAAPAAIRADMVPTPALRVRDCISRREVAMVAMHGGRSGSRRSVPRQRAGDPSITLTMNRMRKSPTTSASAPTSLGCADCTMRLPQSLSNRIPGRFAISIDARDGPRVALPRVTPGMALALRCYGWHRGGVLRRAAWRRGHRNGVSRRGCSRGPGWRRARPGWPFRRPVPMRSRGRGSIESSGLPSGQGSRAVRASIMGSGNPRRTAR